MNRKASTEKRIQFAACEACGKQGFTRRRDARYVKRTSHPEETMATYQCASGMWHNGHAPHDVLRGNIDRHLVTVPAKRERPMQGGGIIRLPWGTPEAARHADEMLAKARAFREAQCGLSLAA